MYSKIDLKIELEKRLISWSWHVLDSNGFPNKSTIANFGINDNYALKSRPPIPIHNLQADEMNHWINIMGSTNPELKIVLKAFYTRRNSEKIATLAQVLGISSRTFSQRLQSARMWLEGRLSIDA